MWHETSDVQQWLAAVGDLLFPEPGRWSIALTVAAADLPGTRWAWWSDGRDVTGAALWCAPYPALLCRAPDEALRPLVDLWSPAAVSGETALAVQWAALSGGTATLRTAQRLFRLGDLVVPDVPGAARVATADDREVVLGWVRAFLAEGDIHEEPESVVDGRLENGQFLVWVVDGVPVSLAGHQVPAYGGVRVGPVYTPPEQRGRGYGGAVTAAVSARAQELGTEVVLYTDLTNPTSNALYPRLGYAPVSDRAVLEISPG